MDSRSWTNSGSVGTSNDSRSALPAQLRNGFESACNSSTSARAAASSLRATSRSSSEMQPASPSPMLAASRMMRSSNAAIFASARSRAGFCPSQSSVWRQRRVVAPGGRFPLLAELRLRADIGPEQRVRLGMPVAFGASSLVLPAHRRVPVGCLRARLVGHGEHAGWHFEGLVCHTCRILLSVLCPRSHLVR